MQAIIHGVSLSGNSITEMIFATIDANVDFKIYRRYNLKSQLYLIKCWILVHKFITNVPAPPTDRRLVFAD